MTDEKGTLALVIGAVIAVAAQVVLAPNIAIFSAQPNFIVAFCLLAAIVRPAASGPVLPFVLGLASDFVTGAPVGSTALLLVLFTFLAARAFAVLNNDTVFMPLLIFVVAALLIEMLSGTFFLALGSGVSVLDAFVYRALPCGLYDCVVGLVLYPLAARVLAPPAPMGPGAPAHL